MDVTLRACTAEELPYFVKRLEIPFGQEAKPEMIERVMRVLQPERTIAAFDGEEIVGNAGDYEFTLTVPGAKVPAAGVTVVGVLPTHRRRGILTKMMRYQLEAIHARSEPVAILWASEGSIYGRYGYGVGSFASAIDLDRDRAKFRHDVPAVGRMRLLDSNKAVDRLAEVYDRVCARTPGMFERSRAWWEAHRLADPESEREGGGPLFMALLEIEGRAEGHALYRVYPKWDGHPAGNLDVIEAMGTDEIATREVWRFLFGVDLVQRIQGWAHPVPHPLLFMLDEPRRLRARIYDSLYVRLVDVAAALRARAYSEEDEIVFQVADPLLAHNEGRWMVRSRDGTAEVESTGAPADIELTINDLGSTYLGGLTFSQLIHGGTVRELSNRALARADRMFRSDVPPWCPQVF